MGRTRVTKHQRPPALDWLDATAGFEQDAAWSVYNPLIVTLPVIERVNVLYRNFRGHMVKNDIARYHADWAPVFLGDSPRLPGHLMAELTWYREAVVGDIDSRVKQTLDLMNGIAYTDDKQIRRLVVEIIDDDRERARIELRLSPYHGYRRWSKGGYVVEP